MPRVGKGIRTAPRDALIASSVDESIIGGTVSFGFEATLALISIILLTLKRKRTSGEVLLTLYLPVLFLLILFS